MERNDNPAQPATGAMRLIARGLNVVVAVAMFTLMAVTFADVVGRYFFSAPLRGSVDIIQMIMGIIVFAALPLVSVRHEHITVDLFVNAFSTRAEAIRRRVVAVISAATLGFIAWRIFEAAESMRAHNQLGFILDVPIAPVVYAMAGLGGLAFVLLALELWRLLRGAAADDTPPAGH